MYEINLKGAEIARRVADAAGRRVLVAGSMGPTVKSLSLSPDVNEPQRRDVSFNQMVQAYMEQVAALIEGGVDLLLVETVYDALNAKAALYAIEEVAGKDFPVMVSATVNDRSGRILSGHTLEALYTAMQGLSELFLEVAESNLPAQRLYEKNGFSAVGRRKGFYGGEDALVMRKQIC